MNITTCLCRTFVMVLVVVSGDVCSVGVPSKPVWVVAPSSNFGSFFDASEETADHFTNPIPNDADLTTIILKPWVLGVYYCVTQHPVVQFPIRIQVPPSQSLPACVGPISSCAEFVQWNSPGFGHSLAKWQSQPRTRRWKGLSARAAPLNRMHWVSQWKVKLVSRFERRAVVYPCLSFKLSNLEPDQMPSLSQRWSFQDKSGHFNCSFDIMFEIVSNVTHIIMLNRCSKTWGFPNIHFHTSNMHFNTSTATSTFPKQTTNSNYESQPLG